MLADFSICGRREGGDGTFFKFVINIQINKCRSNKCRSQVQKLYRRQTEVGADGMVCYDDYYYCYEVQNTIETTPNPNTPRVLEFEC